MAPKNYLGEFEQMLLLAILRKGEATLDRLHAKGYLTWTTRAVEDWRGGRPQRHFEVTTEGVAQLQRSHAALTNLWQGLSDFEKRA